MSKNPTKADYKRLLSRVNHLQNRVNEFEKESIVKKEKDEENGFSIKELDKDYIQLKSNVDALQQTKENLFQKRFPALSAIEELSFLLTLLVTVTVPDSYPWLKALIAIIGFTFSVIVYYLKNSRPGEKNIWIFMLWFATAISAAIAGNFTDELKLDFWEIFVGLGGIMCIIAFIASRIANWLNKNKITDPNDWEKPLVSCVIS